MSTTQDAAPDDNETNTNIKWITGLSHPNYLLDAATSLSHARTDKFDYVVTSLPDTTSDDAAAIEGDAGGVRTDVTRLESNWWSASIVGMVVDPPSWKNKSDVSVDRVDNIAGEGEGAIATNYDGKILLEAMTSTSNKPAASKLRDQATKIFWSMMEWASHMNVPAVILPPVPLVEHGGLPPVPLDGSSGGYREGGIDSSEEDDMFAPPKRANSSNGKSNDGDDDAINRQRKRGRHHNKAFLEMLLHDTDSPASATDTANESALNSSNSNLSANNPSAKEYARLLASLSTSSICSTSHVQLWLRVPLTLIDMQAYQLLLSRCDSSPSVGCMLYINQKVEANELSSIIRALHLLIGGGHVKAVSWDLNVFMKNKNGYPTLSKNHQYIFRMLYGRLGRTLRTLLEGNWSLDASDNIRMQQLHQLQQGGGSTYRKLHLQYLKHLRTRPPLNTKLDSAESIVETPYLDKLQSPLQPLGDHLDYSTYETFEKDPVKYERYGMALELMLEDGLIDERFEFVGKIRATEGELNSLGSDDEGVIDLEDEEYIYGEGGEMVDVDLYQVTILVVGAGRGPLVRESINAVSRVSSSMSQNGGKRRAVRANIIAIEKNPSAVLYLRSLKGSDPSWNGHSLENVDNLLKERNTIGRSNVSIIMCDMRDATKHPMLRNMIQNPKHRADVVVSELLGSFGDNELSPECLDGVQLCGLLKEGCVSIPQR